MTLGSGNPPSQGRRRGISLVATHQHQIKQGDPTQAIYVNNLVKYRTPMDSDDFQTLPLSSAVKFSSETQRLRDDPGFSASPTKLKASLDVVSVTEITISELNTINMIFDDLVNQ